MCVQGVELGNYSPISHVSFQEPKLIVYFTQHLLSSYFEAVLVMYKMSYLGT